MAEDNNSEMMPDFDAHRPNQNMSESNVSQIYELDFSPIYFDG